MPAFFSDIDVGFWILQTFAMMLTCFLLPKLEVSGPIPAFLTVAVLAFVNAHFWDAALFLQIPDSFTVQTLLLILTNAVIFFIVVKLLPGIDIHGIFPAIAAPIIFTVVSGLLKQYASHVDWMKVFSEGVAMVNHWRENFKNAPTQ